MEKQITTSYNEKWRVAYLKEYKTLEKILGSYVLDIQHIGSTSIPGLDTKPVIDIAVGVRTLKDVKFFREQLKRAGYDQLEAFNDQMIFSKQNTVETYCLHIHVYNSHSWCSQIKFRDKLRSNDALRNAYMTTKKELAKLYGEDNKTYAKLKSEFIEKLLT